MKGHREVPCGASQNMHAATGVYGIGWRGRDRERCKIPCPLQRPTALLPRACACALRGWFWSWVGLLPDNQGVWDRSQFAFWHVCLWAHHSTSLFSGGGEKISLPSPSQRNLFRLKKSLRCTSCDVISCYMWEHELVKRQTSLNHKHVLRGDDLGL